ncbi:RES family NAD+ phosphorylase, partial [Xanthomonas citri pv. citri]
MGPPPVEFAIQTNRMSPPGIVMTYVADDPETALAETADKVGAYALGEFVADRDVLILDLTSIPRVPTIFDEIPDAAPYDPRPRLAFLHRVSREISRPIARDDRLHIEYVPTQVITEFVRTSVTLNQKRIEGIRYRSSRHGGRTAIVL